MGRHSKPSWIGSGAAGPCRASYSTGAQFKNILQEQKLKISMIILVEGDRFINQVSDPKH